MGIAKIDTTKRIAKDAARQVTFSKRRSGLFKKAFELSILCELELAIIVFSQKGKVFTFAHPDIDYVIAKYRDPDNVEPYDEEKLKEIHAGVEQLIPRYDQAIEQSKIGKERNQWLKQVRSKVDRKWWESLDIDNMSLQELQRESQELQALLKLFHDHQAYEQQGAESSQLLIHQPQLPLLLPGPSPEEPMMLHNPAPSQLWQSRGPVFGDSGHMAAMPRPAAPGSMMSMQWQQPSSSGGFRDPNLLVSANMRHVLGPQNYMYPGAQPMASFPRVIYGQHFRPQGRDIPTPGSYHPQDHVQQQQQEQQQLFLGGRAMPTYHTGPDYMHQYHVNQQNQQTKHMETFQVGRPLINYAPQLQSTPMGPLMGQCRPHELPSHYQGYPYNYAWESQNFGEPRYEGNQFCGNVRMLNFHLPYDNMGHGPGLPSTSSLNRNFISSGTRMTQIGQGIQAEGDSGSDVAPDDGEVNSGPSLRKIVNSEDCRYSFGSNLAFQNNLAFQGMENVDAAEQYESYGVHESADISQGEHDSEYTQDQGL